MSLCLVYQEKQNEDIKVCAESLSQNNSDVHEVFPSKVV